MQVLQHLFLFLPCSRVTEPQRVCLTALTQCWKQAFCTVQQQVRSRHSGSYDRQPRLGRPQGEDISSLSEAVVTGVAWRRCRRRVGSKSGCLRACLLRWSERMNLFWQTGQTKFFSPVCVLVCRANSSLRANLFLQLGHEHSNGRSPVCVLRCAFRCEDLP